jgi:hypothetical protein
MKISFSPVRAALLCTIATSLTLAACSKSPPAFDAQQSPVPANANEPAAAQSEQDQKAAELAAKEKDLADREAALKQQEIESELAKRNAENAAAATKTASTTKPKTSTSKPAASSTTAAKSPPAPPPQPIAVPAGTNLDVKFASALNSKTSVVGDNVDATLASDLVIDGRRAAKAGAPVHGSVIKVISGSKKIGGTPTLKVKFATLAAADGQTVNINANYMLEGASDTGKDTAKVAGGAAAGAIIGHQVSSKNGALIGGVLGAAGGAAAAQYTGGEVTIDAGTVVTVATKVPFEVTPK